MLNQIVAPWISSLFHQSKGKSPSLAEMALYNLASLPFRPSFLNSSLPLLQEQWPSSSSSKQARLCLFPLPESLFLQMSTKSFTSSLFSKDTSLMKSTLMTLFNITISPAPDLFPFKLLFPLILL